jgi:hypothetical protein
VEWSFIERRGEPVAELRPITTPPRLSAEKKARMVREMQEIGTECRRPVTAQSSLKRTETGDAAALCIATRHTSQNLI